MNLFKFRWKVGNIKSFIKRQTSGTSGENEWQQWQRGEQRVTTNDNEWYNEWKRAVNEWQRVVQRMATSDSKWQRVTMSKKEWQPMKTNDSESQKVIQRVIQLMKICSFKTAIYGTFVRRMRKGVILFW